MIVFVLWQPRAVDSTLKSNNQPSSAFIVIIYVTYTEPRPLIRRTGGRSGSCQWRPPTPTVIGCWAAGPLSIGWARSWPTRWQRGRHRNTRETRWGGGPLPLWCTSSIPTTTPATLRHWVDIRNYGLNFRRGLVISMKYEVWCGVLFS